jgi:hypothetical protein
MAMNFVLAAFVWFFIPETKQVALEDIDVLFGGVNHTDKGAQMLGQPAMHQGQHADAAAGEDHMEHKDGHAVTVQQENRDVENAR